MYYFHTCSMYEVSFLAKEAQSFEQISLSIASSLVNRLSSFDRNNMLANGLLDDDTIFVNVYQFLLNQSLQYQCVQVCVCVCVWEREWVGGVSECVQVWVWVCMCERVSESEWCECEWGWVDVCSCVREWCAVSKNQR